MSADINDPNNDETRRGITEEALRADLRGTKMETEMTKLSLSEIAKAVAIDVKATGFDMGDVYDTDWNLTDAEWDSVCDEAETLLPTIKVPASVYAAWAQADRDVRAEQRAERIAFSGDR